MFFVYTARDMQLCKLEDGTFTVIADSSLVQMAAGCLVYKWQPGSGDAHMFALPLNSEGCSRRRQVCKANESKFDHRLPVGAAFW